MPRWRQKRNALLFTVIGSAVSTAWSLLHAHADRQTDKQTYTHGMCIIKKWRKRGELSLHLVHVVLSDLNIFLLFLLLLLLLFCCSAFDCVGQRRRETRIFIGAQPTSLLYDDAHICIRLHLTKEEEEVVLRGEKKNIATSKALYR